MTRTVAAITEEIAKASKAEDWDLVERLYDERRVAEVGGEEAYLQEWGQQLDTEIEDLTTKVLCFALDVEFAVIASVGERKRYGWDMIEGGQPT